MKGRQGRHRVLATRAHADKHETTHRQQKADDEAHVQGGAVPTCHRDNRREQRRGRHDDTHGRRRREHKCDVLEQIIRSDARRSGKDEKPFVTALMQMHDVRA